MALQKNVISVPIFGGIDTKTDEKLLPNGSLRKLTNGVFNKTGRISKRNGYKKITDNTNVFPNDLQGLWESNGKLIYRDGRYFKTKDGAIIGNATSINADVNLVGETKRDPYVNQDDLITYSTSYARYENFEIYQLDGGTKPFIIKKDGYFLKDLGACGVGPQQVHATPMGFIILYKNSTLGLFFRFYNFETNTLEPEVSVAVGAKTYDATFVNDTLFVVYSVETLSPGVLTTRMVGLNMVGEISPIYGDIDIGTVPVNLDAPVRICGEVVNGEVKLMTSALTSAVNITNNYFINYVDVYSYTIDLVLNPLEETDAAVMNFITDLNGGIASHMVSRTTELNTGILWESKVAVVSNYQWVQNLNTQALVAKTNFARGLVPAGRSFKINGLTYFPMAYIYADAPSMDYPTYGYEYGKMTTEPTLFFYDSSAREVVGRTLSENIQDVCSLSSVFVDGQKAYIGAVSENNVCSLDITLNNEVKGSVKNGQNLILNTGKLLNFDGKNTFTQGFYTFPEIKRVSLAGTGGPTGPIMDLGDKISYQAVFSFKDAYGKVYESATSIPVQYVKDTPIPETVFLAVAIYLDYFNLNPATLNTKGSLSIDLYRTEVNGSVFYKCASQFVEVFDIGKANWMFFDSMDDSALVANPAIYTTGGILDNEMVDNIEGLTSFSNRTIVWSGNTIYFSKAYIDGNPIYFNINALYLKVPESLGGVKSLAYIDDSLAIFTDIGIYAISGTPADNTGQNSSLSNFTIISKEMGANDTQNLITSIGVFFKCPRGIYLLPRGFGQIQYIGAPVEEYNNIKINTMFISQKDTSFYFLLDNKTALVYNSLYSFWSVFDTFENKGGAVFKDLVNILDKDGNILEESPGTWTHDLKPIKLTIGTQWIKLNGIQGYQRVWKMLLLGNYKSPHKMRVKMAFDYLPYHDPSCERIMDSTAQYQHIYGLGGGHYGESGYGLGGPLQWDISPRWQKCEAISFEISDLQDPTGGYGPSFELNDLTIVAGVKRGPMQLPKGRKG